MWFSLLGGIFGASTIYHICEVYGRLKKLVSFWYPLFGSVFIIIGTLVGIVFGNRNEKAINDFIYFIYNHKN